jgi:hypothetical protein
MSGFEPMFMAAAAETAAPAVLASAGAEIGTAALLSEVAGTSMMMGLPTLGAAFAPTAMNGLAALAPEIAGTMAGTLAPAIQPALTGLTAAQGTSLLNSSMPGMLSEAQIAQMVNPATDLAANAKTLGQVAQASAPPITDAGMQNVFNAYKQAPVAQELVSQAPQIVPEVSSAYTGSAAQTAFPSGSSAYTSAAAPPAAAKPGFLDTALDYVKNNKMNTLSMGMNAMNLLGKGKKGGSGKDEDEEYDGPLSKFKYDPSRYVPGTVTPPTPYKPVYKDYRMAGGGVVELMSDQNAIGANTGYPMADINKGAYATPYQQPISRNVLTGASDTGVNPMTGEMQFAGGGIADLGGYSDYAGGGRMLKGPGDGMSDNIPATIAGKQPARLANEEFVIPADVVSHLGNGSSEAGAKQLYKMMDRVRQARTGKKAQGKQIKAAKLMPA